MSDKSVLLLVLFATVFISGCIFDKESMKSDFIPQSNLPPGYTYMGIHETAVPVGDTSLNAVEGVYRYNGDDLYIQAIKNENPSALISRYKLKYKDANYDPFEEVSFNGHKATKVADYPTINGKQKPKYTVIWATGEYMLIVGSSTEASSVMALATATDS